MLAQGIGHRRLGAVGNHLDDVDEVLALGAELAKALLFRQLLDADMPRGGLAFGFEDRDILL